MDRRAATAVSALAATYGIGAAITTGRSPGTALAFGLLGLLLGLGERRPVTVASAAALLGLAVAFMGDGVPTAGFPLLAAHVFATARRESLAISVSLAVAILAACEIAEARAHESLVVAVFVLPTAWTIGRTLGARERLTERLADRARELDEERDAYVELSVRYERARIASELHDIVAHAISVMVVQASAGQRLVGIDPELTDETFAGIADAARQAEQDIGRLVTLLSDEPTSVTTEPDLQLVRELVTRANGSGLHVTLRVTGAYDTIPSEAAALAYRIVQEGLTNALRYAAGAPVRVELTAGTDRLAVSVTNGPASRAPELTGAGTGNGLKGLRERLDTTGGTVDAGPLPDGGWRIHAHVPLTRALSTRRDTSR